MVFTSRIFQALHQFPDGIALAGAYSLPLVVLTCGGALLLGVLTRRRSAFETVSGRGIARQPLTLGRARTPMLALVALYLTVTVVLPMLALIWMSTQPYLASPSAESFARASLEGYTDVLDDPTTIRAFSNSILLGTAAATITVTIGAVVAWFAVRSAVRGRRSADALAFLPLAPLPGIVLGTSLLAFWVRMPWTIYGTLWILLLAYPEREQRGAEHDAGQRERKKPGSCGAPPRGERTAKPRDHGSDRHGDHRGRRGPEEDRVRDAESSWGRRARRCSPRGRRERSSPPRGLRGRAASTNASIGRTTVLPVR